ncbi:MAG: hypothetical protein ABI045_06145 [Flavobacteriales bacterium]
MKYYKNLLLTQAKGIYRKYQDDGLNKLQGSALNQKLVTVVRRDDKRISR